MRFDRPDRFRRGHDRGPGRRRGPGEPRIRAQRGRARHELRDRDPARISRLEVNLRAHEEGDLNDLRAILGNDVATKAYREGTLPFPDGTIIARLAWNYQPSEENNKAFGRAQSFVAGPPKNGLQFMVKNATKYAATGCWSFAQFNDGKPADAAVHATCLVCHQAVQERDLVFTRYAP